MSTTTNTLFALRDSQTALGHDAAVHDICPSQAKNHHIYVRTLHEACVRLGGEHKLAHYLGVEVELVNAWLNGQGRPPDAIFLRCVDLVQSAEG
jgi:hypothetical protein